MTQQHTPRGFTQTMDFLSLRERRSVAQVRGKANKANPICTPSSALRASSPSRGKGTRGFTLIELLVVVLIIGILAAIAVPQYQKAVVRARYQQAVIFGDLCFKAQQLYYAEHGEYTLDFNNFQVSLPTPSKGEYSNTVHYPWGWCQLRRNGTTIDNGSIIDMNCYPEKAPRYQVNFNTGIRTCFGGKDSLILNAVCQAETGKQDPDYKHPTVEWWSWDYEN